MSEMVRWWHYTLARTLVEILVSGWRLSYDDVPLSQIVNIEASPDGRSWRSVDEFGWWNHWRDEPAKSLERRAPAEAALPGFRFYRALIITGVILIAALFGAWLGLR
jgi:hypothetical protein